MTPIPFTICHPTEVHDFPSPMVELLTPLLEPLRAGNILRIDLGNYDDDSTYVLDCLRCRPFWTSYRLDVVLRVAALDIYYLLHPHLAALVFPPQVYRRTLESQPLESSIAPRIRPCPTCVAETEIVNRQSSIVNPQSAVPV